MSLKSRIYGAVFIKGCNQATSSAERLDLISGLWDSIGARLKNSVLPIGTLLSLNDAWPSADANPAAAIPLEEVKQRLRRTK